MRTLLITLLTTSCFALPLNAVSANEPVKKAAVRALDLKNVYPNASGEMDKPIVLTNAAELRTKLNVRQKGDGRHRLEKLIEGIDFKKEQVLFFACSGSGQFTFKVECCPKQPSDVTGVTFQIQRGQVRGGQSQFHLVVLPKNTPWSIADEKKKAE